MSEILRKVINGIEHIEEWKDVVGYEGYYMVSSFGRVKSLDRIVWNGSSNYLKKGRIMKLNNTPSGYKEVHLYIDGFRKRMLVHRLVGLAFICNSDNKPEIDHIDTIRNNNFYKNLKWATIIENRNNPLSKINMSNVRIGKCIGKDNYNYGNKGDKNPISKPVLQFTKSGDFIKRHENGFLAAGAIGCHYSNISRCCNNVPKYKSAGGFKWQFETTEKHL